LSADQKSVTPPAHTFFYGKKIPPGNFENRLFSVILENKITGNGKITGAEKCRSAAAVFSCEG